jgi:hypothetical protein
VWDFPLVWSVNKTICTATDNQQEKITTTTNNERMRDDDDDDDYSEKTKTDGCTGSIVRSNDMDGTTRTDQVSSSTLQQCCGVVDGVGDDDKDHFAGQNDPMGSNQQQNLIAASTATATTSMASVNNAPPDIAAQPNGKNTAVAEQRSSTEEAKVQTLAIGNQLEQVIHCTTKAQGLLNLLLLLLHDGHQQQGETIFEEESRFVSPKGPTVECEEDDPLEEDQKASSSTISHRFLVQASLLKRIADNLVKDLQKNTQDASSGKTSVGDESLAGPRKSFYKKDQEKDRDEDWNRVQDHKLPSTAFSSFSFSSTLAVCSTTDKGSTIKEHTMASSLGLEHPNQKTLPGVECDQDRPNEVDGTEQVEQAQVSQADPNEADVLSMMQAPLTHKAWMIASQVSSIIDERVGPEETRRSHNDEIWGLQALAKDDLFYFAQALLRLQADFRLAGKPTRVDWGFHYTQQASLSRIRTNGLLTKADRKSRKITTKTRRASTHGDGIYTCNDHWEGVLGKYGNVGILVARLPGERSIDSTFVDDRHMVVLKQSEQCLPLVLFPRWMIGSPILNDVQNAMIQMVNHFMNDHHEDDDVGAVVASSGKLETASSIEPSPILGIQGSRLVSSVGQGQQDKSGSASNRKEGDKSP